MPFGLLQASFSLNKDSSSSGSGEAMFQMFLSVADIIQGAKMEDR